jgi:hypothetical protein
LQQEIIRVQDSPDFALFFNGQLQTEDLLLREKLGNQVNRYGAEVESDTHASSVLEKRRKAVVSREWQIDPASDKPKDVLAADICRMTLERLNFDEGCENLLNAVLVGRFPTEIMWASDTLDMPNGTAREVYMPTELRGKDPARIVFSLLDKATNPNKTMICKGFVARQLTRQNMFVGEPLPANKVVIHSYGSKTGNPYGLGLGNKLWWMVRFKKEVLKFWLIFLDKFAQPTPYGETPDGGDKAEMEDFLQRITGGSWAVLPAGFKVNFLEAQRTSSVSTYEGFENWIDAQVSKCVLGETLTTQHQDTGGSRAATQVHNDVRKEIAKADSDNLSSTVEEYLLKPITLFNVPGARTPQIYRLFEEQEDLNTRAERDNVLFSWGWKLKEESVVTIYGDDYFYEKPEPPPNPFDNPIAPGKQNGDGNGSTDDGRNQSKPDQPDGDLPDLTLDEDEGIAVGLGSIAYGYNPNRDDRGRFASGSGHGSSGGGSSSKGGNGKARKALKTAVGGAEHVAENVTSWKAGKLLGGAIAHIASTHGVDHEAAKLIAETAVQATVATLIHARNPKHTGATAKELATHFIAEAAAAFVGKVSHGSAEGVVAALGGEHEVKMIAAAIAGKGAGLATNITANRSGLAATLAARLGVPAGRLHAILQKALPQNASHSTDYANPGKAVRLTKADQQAIYELTRAGYILAAMEDLRTSDKAAKSDKSDNSELGEYLPEYRAVIHKVIKYTIADSAEPLHIGLEYIPGDVRFRGTKHARKLRHGYGHIRNHVAEDGEALDGYVHPDLTDPPDDYPTPNTLYKVRQLKPNPDGTDDWVYDEAKLMIGFPTMDDAESAYLSEMPEQFYGGISRMSASELSQYRKPDFEEDREPEKEFEGGELVPLTFEMDGDIHFVTNETGEVLFYNPDQPRDARGRWISTKGGGGGGGGSSSSNATKKTTAKKTAAKKSGKATNKTAETKKTAKTSKTATGSKAGTKTEEKGITNSRTARANKSKSKTESGQASGDTTKEGTAKRSSTRSRKAKLQLHTQAGEPDIRGIDAHVRAKHKVDELQAAHDALKTKIDAKRERGEKVSLPESRKLYSTESKLEKAREASSAEGLKLSAEAIKTAPTYNEARAVKPQHGMSRTENMWSVQHDGIIYHGTGVVHETHPVVKTVRNMGTGEPLPHSLTRHTGNVYTTNQANKDDAHWRKVYTNFTASAATGGNGDVVIYNGGSATRNTMIHEMGHNLAKGRYGATSPKTDSEFQKASLTGVHVTSYAKNSISEDFAESVAAYFTNPAKLKEASSERFSVINKIIKDEKFSGQEQISTE